jgi:CRISPR system Cascade subunit CasD
MPRYLTFQLYAPLSSWGEPAVGEKRNSARHPSKSAVLGLVAAAMGYRRQSDEPHLELQDSLSFGVKLVGEAFPTSDYHTIQPEKKRNRHVHKRKDEIQGIESKAQLSYRQYRQDALNVVALWNTDNAQIGLHEILSSLKQPKFSLFVGRKSCPLALPLNPILGEHDSLKTALDSYPTDPALTYPPSQRVDGYFWEQTDHAGQEAHYTVSRSDQILSRERWQHGPRTEFVAFATSQNEGADHVS